MYVPNFQNFKLLFEIYIYCHDVSKDLIYYTVISCIKYNLTRFVHSKALLFLRNICIYMISFHPFHEI